MGIKANNIDLKSDRMKFLEGCIEAPLQICLQLYIVVAGNIPGNKLRIRTLFLVSVKN